MVKLDPLGIGKYYHDYDTNGGIKTLNEDVKYSEIDQDDTNDDNQQENVITENFDNIIKEQDRQSDKVTLPDSNNKIDEAGNPQC